MARPGGDSASPVPEPDRSVVSLDRSQSEDLALLPGFGLVPAQALINYNANKKLHRIRRNLTSFLSVELRKQIQEHPYYAFVSYLYTQFLDTIDLGSDCGGSILCCPQPRFRKLKPSTAIQDSGITLGNAVASPAAATVPSPSLGTIADPPQPDIVNAPPVSDEVLPGQGLSGKKKKAPSGDKWDHRDPDFAQYAYFKSVEGVSGKKKVLGSWVEVKPEPPELWAEAEREFNAQLSYEDELVRDMPQLREQADRAFSENPETDAYLMSYIRGTRFTAFKWSQSAGMGEQLKRAAQDTPPTQSLRTSSEVRTESHCAVAPQARSSDQGQPEVPTTVAPSAKAQCASPASRTRIAPRSSGSASEDPSKVAPVPIDPSAFKGCFRWEKEQFEDLVRAAETAKVDFWRDEVEAHKGRISSDELVSLQAKYDALTPESLVNSHPQPLYHYANVLEGTEHEMRAAYRFTNMLRLSHSGLSPTGDLTFEHSTFFSLLNDENLYRPSDIESKATMELMTRIYTKTLTRAWGPQLEDKRKESPDPPETGNTSNTTYQYSEGTQSSDNSLGSYEWGDVLEDLELLRADGLSVDAPASPGPGPQRHDEPLDTASPDKRVHFDHSTFATSNQTVETARPKTRSATRISQGNETNSQSASSSGPRAPDTGPPGPSTQEASTSGARERERKKTNGPGGTRRPVALEANATRTTTTRPKTTRTATSQTASTRAIDTQSNSGVAVVRSTRSTGSTANAPSGRSTANANVPAADGDGDGPSMAGPSRPRRAGARYDAPTKSSKAKSTATKAKDAVKASGSGTDTMDRKGKKRLREEVNLEPDEPPDRQESPPKKKKR